MILNIFAIFLTLVTNVAVVHLLILLYLIGTEQRIACKAPKRIASSYYSRKANTSNCSEYNLALIPPYSYPLVIHP
jgi:hypothetical protein